jgi:hypothetical protein
MQGKTERWQHLCELAAIEQDPEKLIQLVREINDLLDEKRRRLTTRPTEQADSPPSGSHT